MLLTSVLYSDILYEQTTKQRENKMTELIRECGLVPAKILEITNDVTTYTYNAFYNENFNNAVFKETDFVYGRYKSCDFTNTVFINCNLFSADFSFCDFANATFINCNFSEATLYKGNFSYTSFLNCDFYGMLVKTVSFETCSFVNSVANNSEFQDTMFCKRTKLEEVKLNKTVWIRSGFDVSCRIHNITLNEVSEVSEFHIAGIQTLREVDALFKTTSTSSLLNDEIIAIKLAFKKEKREFVDKYGEEEWLISLLRDA